MLKSVLMAAPLAPASSQIPTLPIPQYANPTLNMPLENAMNPASTLTRGFNSNFSDWSCAGRDPARGANLQRPAYRERGDVARPRRGTLAGRRVGVRHVAALHLGIDSADDAFRHR